MSIRSACFRPAHPGNSQQNVRSFNRPLSQPISAPATARDPWSKVLKLLFKHACVHLESCAAKSGTAGPRHFNILVPIALPRPHEPPPIPHDVPLFPIFPASGHCPASRLSPCRRPPAELPL